MAFTLERELLNFLQDREAIIQATINQKLAGQNLQSLLNQNLHHRQSQSQLLVEDIIREVIDLVGQTVSQASMIVQAWEPQKSAGPYHLSFLPQYTLKGREEGRYILPRTATGALVDLRYQVERAAPQTLPRAARQSSPLSLIYQELFCETDAAQANPFRGSTTQWMAAVIDHLILGAPYGAKLAGVAYYKRAAAAHRQQKRRLHWLHIPGHLLGVEGIERWCTEALRFFNHHEYRQVDPPLHWPHNEAFRMREPPPLVLLVRAYLVGLWLRVAFYGSDLGEDWWAFLERESYLDQIRALDAEDPAAEYLLNFESLKGQLRRLREQLAAERHPAGPDYEYCYLLPFRKNDKFKIEGASMGITQAPQADSVLLLTDYELGDVFFDWVAPWIGRIFNLLEDLERADKIRVYALDGGWKIFNQQLRHNIQRHLRALRNVQNVEKIPDLIEDIDFLVGLTEHMATERDMRHYILGATEESAEKQLRSCDLQTDIVGFMVGVLREDHLNQHINYYFPSRSTRKLLRRSGPDILQYDPLTEVTPLRTNPEVARLIFKDLLTNAIKNVNGEAPQVRIRVNATEAGWRVTIENNHAIDAHWMQRINSTDESILDSVENLGIYMYKRCARVLG
ncbi:MAG: hypothetical protein AAFW73_13630, partial [Bacteroidota bacterium]